MLIYLVAAPDAKEAKEIEREKEKYRPGWSVMDGE
jgi:hypothetical protein